MKPALVEWTKARRSSRPGPCLYRCGKTAWLIPPGGNQVAHKVCADAAAGIESREVAPGGGEYEASKAEPRALGCGTPAPGQTSGRVCAGTGAELSCQLCPSSPTYWGGEGTIRREVVTADVDGALG